MSGVIGRTPPEAVKMASSVAATAATLNNTVQCDGQQTEKQSYQTGHPAAESSNYGGGGLPPDVKEKLHVRIGLISFRFLVAFIHSHEAHECSGFAQFRDQMLPKKGMLGSIHATQTQQSPLPPRGVCKATEPVDGLQRPRGKRGGS
jgi:hypothetical protein